MASRERKQRRVERELGKWKYNKWKEERMKGAIDEYREALLMFYKIKRILLVFYLCSLSMYFYKLFQHNAIFYIHRPLSQITKQVVKNKFCVNTSKIECCALKTYF